jgi:hypothetical protein
VSVAFNYILCVLTFVTVTLSATRNVPRETRLTHATLVSISILYRWRSKPQVITGAADFLDHPNPFSSTLFLPLQTILNMTVEKFVSVHLVKCVYFVLRSQRRTFIFSQTISFYFWLMVPSNSAPAFCRANHLPCVLRNSTWRPLFSCLLLAQYLVY